ncbi:MAG: M15 family metallopeptidase [Psychromonas sp.]|nr:M15 family metallopeptidase [Psychromonas sp.]
MNRLDREQLTGTVTTHVLEYKKNILMHSQTKKAFDALKIAAKKNGFNLCIASGFRDFKRQQLIWNNKYSGNTVILDKYEQRLDINKLKEIEKISAILYWSALPGASRHHWGSDLDIFDETLLPQNQSLQLITSEYDHGGYFSELTQWLHENITHFDFYLPYKADLGGVAREPWHISYRPISENALLDLDEALIFELISNNNVLGKSLICETLPMIYKKFITNISH